MTARGLSWHSWSDGKRCRSFIVRMGYNQLHFFLTVQDTLKFVDEEKEKNVKPKN